MSLFLTPLKSRRTVPLNIDVKIDMEVVTDKIDLPAYSSWDTVMDTDTDKDTGMGTDINADTTRTYSRQEQEQEQE